jgi:hypothetical protein
LRGHLSDCGIEVIEEPSGTAIGTFNRLYGGGKMLLVDFI